MAKKAANDFGMSMCITEEAGGYWRMKKTSDILPMEVCFKFDEEYEMEPMPGMKLKVRITKPHSKLPV